MKIFPILSCNLSNIELIKYAFAHFVLLNCKFRHTKTLFSDHQNSVKSSPQSSKWHFRDSKFKNFLGPLALAFSPPPPIKKSFLQHCLIITAYWPSVRSVLWNIRPRFFRYGLSDEGARSMQKTEVWYFTVQTEQTRSIIGLLYGWTESVSICFSRELNRLSSVSLGNNIR
jgi:hypothetical protein